MSDQIMVKKGESTGLSIRDLFYKYIRFLPFFILSIALALLGAYLYLRYTVPVYNVNGTMLIKNEQPATGRADSFDELLGNNKALNIQSEIEVLKSRPLMERVVDSLGLNFEYSAVGKIKTVNVYRSAPFRIETLGLVDSSKGFTIKVKFINTKEFVVNDELTTTFNRVFRNKNGVFRITGDANAGTEYKLNWQSSSTRAKEFSSAVQVVPKVAGTGILIVSMRSTNAQLASDIVNELMSEYGNYTIEQKNRTLDKTLGFVSERLDTLKKKLDSAQNVLLDFKQKNDLIDADAQAGNFFTKISESDKIVNEQRLKSNVAEMISEYLIDKKNIYNQVPVVPSSLGLEDPTLNELVSFYNAAQFERQQLLDANIPVGNPAVQQANSRIEKLRISILENIKNIKGSVNASISIAKNEASESQVELLRLPVKVKEQLEMQRQVELLQNLYSLFISKGEETAISKSSNISNSDIINKALPNDTPVKPNRTTIRIMAILIGLAIPALFIFLSEVLNDKVTTRSDIEKITEVPILGEIGHSYSNDVLVVNKNTRSMVAEQFRIIRSNLQYVLNKKEKAIILTTSSFSGEGKSFVSTNIAAVLALAGKKTIVLEFDIRKPKVLAGLDMPKGPGITNFLVGKSKLEEVIRPVDGHENLFVLGCGPVPPNPSELLLDQRVSDMFSWLRENFDMVVIDTAPVGMVSDALTLGKFADCTLYLVRQGHTFKKQIALIDDFYKAQKLPKVSIVINDVKLKLGYGYYGYGRYGYGYGYDYGSYYEEEQSPQSIPDKIISVFDVRKWFKKRK